MSETDQAGKALDQLLAGKTIEEMVGPEGIKQIV